MVNFFQDDTFVVEHKPLFHNVLAIFRVDETATLKMTNLLYDNYLRSTQKKAKAQTAKLKDRAGIVSTYMLARSRMFEI